MGTKNNPGKFDCYANAQPDEPMFVLLARDQLAPGIVRIWALAKALFKPNSPKIAEALQCANAMEKWGNHVSKDVGTCASPSVTEQTCDQNDKPKTKIPNTVEGLTEWLASWFMREFAKLADKYGADARISNAKAKCTRAAFGAMLASGMISVKQNPLVVPPWATDEAKADLDDYRKLVRYFGGEGYGEYGFAGDEESKTPATVAIESLQHLSKLRTAMERAGVTIRV